MDLSALADVGEFVGGVAVIVSLIYLAVQIRQNTRSVRGASFQALSDSLSDRVFRLAENAELHEVYARGLRDEQLSEQEAQRFQSLMISLIRLCSNAFVQYRSGLLSEDQWRGFRVMPTTLLSLPGGKRWWKRGRVIFGEEFAAHIEAAIQQSEERGAQQSAAAAER